MPWGGRVPRNGFSATWGGRQRLSDRFPELRLNLLTGIIDGNVSIAEARIYLEGETGRTPKRDIVADALEIAARERAWDPLIQHIRVLPQWDGEERVDTWRAKDAGAE